MMPERRPPMAACLATLLLAPLAAASPHGAPGALAADDACTSAGPGPALPACSLSALQMGTPGRQPAHTQGNVELVGTSADKYLDGVARMLGSPGRGVKRGFIKVLGGGLPKTGTTSLKVALDRLGYKAAHGEFLELTSKYQMWSQWEHGDPQPAIDTMLDMGFEAALDIPWFWGYKDFLKLNPDLKVILNKHPVSADAWALAYAQWSVLSRDSSPAPLLREWNATPGTHFTNEMTLRHLNCRQGWPTDRMMTRAQIKNCSAGYTAWLNQVRADVPPHQLLEYNITQGWQPLCEFLNVTDCPRDPFPHEHDPIPLTIRSLQHDIIQKFLRFWGLPHEDDMLPPATGWYWWALKTMLR